MLNASGKGVAAMLLGVATHADYLEASDAIAAGLSESEARRLGSGRHAEAREALRMLDLDAAAPLLLSLYSQTTGRPANDPTTYVRSLVLMLRLGYTSIQRWVDDARADSVLQCLVGTTRVPAASCHYDFINRITGDDPHLDELYPEGLFTRELKQMRRDYQLKRGEKLVNFDEGDTAELTERYRDDASCDAGRWTLPLERVLDVVAVAPSMERYGLAGCTLSGDGTCLHVHASRSGHRVVDPPDGGGAAGDEDGDSGGGGDAGGGGEDGEPPRTHRYTAPDASVGWDSDLEEYYLGYVLYNVSWHSRDLGIDLPVFVALRPASQHDALTCVSSVAHMLDVDPALAPEFFCHDSAADAAHIFEWMRHRGTVPIIDWNPRHSSKDADERRPVARGLKDADGRPLEYVNSMGVPVCAGGHEMARDGYDRSKMATKYRCPLAVGRVEECDMWGVCTKSDYGRVLKTYDKTDFKLFGPVPYRSERWKDIYKDRTCTERVNNRILNDYGLHQLTCRNGYKHFFFAVMAAINIHLDAWAKAPGPGAPEGAAA